MKTEALAPAKLPPIPTLIELGRGNKGEIDPTRSAAEISVDLQRILREVDLTNIKPSQLRVLAVELYAQDKISEDVASEFLLARRVGAKGLTDDHSFNLIETMRQGLKRSGAIMQRYPFADSARWYEEAGAAARGLNEVIAYLRKHPRVDVRA